MAEFTTDLCNTYPTCTDIDVATGYTTMRQTCVAGNVVVVVLVFHDPSTFFSGHFGRGQLIYPHCFWACLISSLVPVHKDTIFSLYEDRSEIIEAITILSIGLNVIQNNLHSHQLLHIWGLGMN